MLAFSLNKPLFLTILIYGLHALNISAANPQLLQKQQGANDFRNAAKEALPAVVSIRVQTSKNLKSKTDIVDPWGQYSEEDAYQDLLKRFFGSPLKKGSSTPNSGQASGFVVSPDGYIMTNNHVVEGRDDIKVTFNDGSEYQASLVGTDINTDIALIKIDAQNLPYLKFGDSDALEVAQWIMSIGTPLGLQATVTVGVVSAKGRNNLDLARIEDFIQTDAPINQGNSGGPLLNVDGEVVGINTAIASTMGGYMGIGFSIPSNIAKNVKDQLISKGRVSRSFIGLELQQIDRDLASAFGLHRAEGALVAQVVVGSPADKAGILQGDIILKFDDHPVKSVGAFRTSIALMNPGSNLKLFILRNEKPIEISLATADFSAAALQEESNTVDLLGIIVTNLTPEIAQKLNYQHEIGVIITQVGSNSLGEFAGLRKGTLIMAVNQNKVASVEQFKKELTDADKTKPVLLLVKEGTRVQFISFKIN